MSSLAFDHEPLACALRFRGNRMIVVLKDRRELAVPLESYPTLLRMTPKERAGWRLIGPGVGFHWPEYDLDLSVRQFLEGAGEHVPPPSWYAQHPRPVDLRRADRRRTSTRARTAATRAMPAPMRKAV